MPAGLAPLHASAATACQPARLPTHLGKLVHPVVRHIILHAVCLLAEDVEGVHEATQHCSSSPAAQQPLGVRYAGLEARGSGVLLLLCSLLTTKASRPRTDLHPRPLPPVDAVAQRTAAQRACSGLCGKVLPQMPLQFVARALSAAPAAACAPAALGHRGPPA
jgi:hypothetical protein